jgi:TolB-like protein/tetratricopeptide (TPR) repeat protein
MSLFQELKRRNVIRVAAAYAVTAWLILQIADVILGNIGAPSWVFPTILMVVALGFPVALVFAWAFELTPDGLKREADVDRTTSITRQTGRRLDRVIIGVLAIAVVYFAWDKFLSGPDAEVTRTASANKASIAVLPFVNMSSDPEQEYFSEGISEELLNLLAKVPQFQVAGRTSSFEFKGQNDDLREIGELLGVDNILEGSVRKGGDRVRITAQLVSVDDGFHLWSDTYDRELDDIFAVQDQIANAVVGELKLKLLGAEIPAVTSAPLFKDSDAHNFFLQGRYFMSRLGPDNSARAIEAFQKAVDIAPESALALAGLAAAKVRYAGQAEEGQSEALAEGRALAARALSMDDQVPEVHLVRADLAYSHDWDWATAEKALDQVLVLRPGDINALGGKADIALTLGRVDESVAMYRELLERDPMNDGLAYGMVRRMITIGNYAEGEAIARRLVQQDPDENFANGYLAWVLAEAGRHEESIEYAKKEPVNFIRNVALGINYYLIGDEEAGRQAAQALEDSYGAAAAYQLAIVAMAAGDADEAMRWLEVAYEVHDPGMTAIKTDTLLAPLHDDPRFIALLEKMNLVNEE